MFDFHRPIDKSRKVFVAMSGGVDSSVVAGLMKEEGYDVVGVTMCFSITHPGSRKPSCCGVDGIQDAQRAAQILGVPHYVMDFAKDINDHIIDDFTSEYLSGRTPNPCARCNQHLKFGTLYQKVMQLGGGYLATGHYSKIHHNTAAGHFELKKANDHRKDQSYFLYSMKWPTLEKTIFPLGDLTKDEVRDLARKYDLNVADKPESQDICFVPDAGYKEFIRQRLGDEVFVPGDFIDENGEVVGEHKGIANYTIGQRDKLGIALGFPVYVNRIDRAKNTVHVGPVARLYSRGLKAAQFNALSDRFPLDEPVRADVRIRYNSPAFPGTVTRVSETEVRVEFDEPQKAVTPGQSAVFYDGDVVLGGATIDVPVRCEIGEVPEAILHQPRQPHV